LSVFPAYVYRMTVFSRRYDAREGFARTHEFYFVTRRRGSRRTVRRTLARKGIPYFQQAVYRWHRQWIPAHKIRVSFETEEQTEAVDRKIRIYPTNARYCGKQYAVTRLPPREIAYARRSRRTKTRKGKCAKGR
jgi:hypothetical protein